MSLSSIGCGRWIMPALAVDSVENWDYSITVQLDMINLLEHAEGRESPFHFLLSLSA